MLLGARSLRRGLSNAARASSVFDVAGPLRVHAETPYLVASRAVGPFQMNQYFISCNKTKKAAIIDSGSPPRRFLDLARSHGATITSLLQTHGHIDHMAGVAETKDALPKAPIHLHKGDYPLYKQAAALGAKFGIDDVAEPPEPDVWIEDGDVLSVGDIRLKAIHTPGHCPGHVCFYDEDAQILFAGDLLFQNSIGRTDLWGASPPDMERSLERVMALPDAVRVFPGHGDPTTIGNERRWNPFVAGMGS